MNFDGDIWFIRYSMYLIGIWPEETPYTRVKFIVSVVLNLIGATVSFRAIPLIKNEVAFMTNMSYSLSFTLITYKMYMMKRKKATITKLFSWIDENWKCYENLPRISQAVMCQQSRKSKQLTIMIYTMIGLTLFCLLLGPTVEAFIKHTSIAKISKEGWFSFPVESSFSVSMLFIIRAVSSSCAAITWSSIDCCVISIVLHICGQMRILCFVINNFKERLKHDDQFLNNRRNSCSCCCLHCIVDRHNKIFEFSMCVEDCINMIIFLKLSVQGAQICTVGYLIMTSKKDVVSMIAMNFWYFLTIIYTTVIYGWLGEQLTQRGYEIGDAAYASSWYEFSQPKMRRILSVIISRAQRPIRITAGKYFYMSMDTVGQTIVTSMSYLSVIYAVQSSNR